MPPHALKTSRILVHSNGDTLKKRHFQKIGPEINTYLVILLSLVPLCENYPLHKDKDCDCVELIASFFLHSMARHAPLFHSDCYPSVCSPEAKQIVKTGPFQLHLPLPLLLMANAAKVPTQTMQFEKRTVLLF